jgi:hypothetical protein
VCLDETDLAGVLGHADSQTGQTVLFASAVDKLNSLLAAQSAHRLKAELKK